MQGQNDDPTEDPIMGACFGVRYEVAEDGYTIPVARSTVAVTADGLSSLDVGFL